MKHLSRYFYLALMIFPIGVYSQVARNGELYRIMDLGVEKMERGEYQEAEKDFLYVMDNLEALPSDLVYYFGRNSFHLSKYKQSINWLNKYIQLKGTQGRFYQPAVKYLQFAEDEYIKESRVQTAELQQLLQGDDYDCRGLSKMLCPVCRGSGVLVKQGPFEKIFKTCPYCAGEAYLTCEEYNQFMRGEFDPKIQE